ncbi:hypothetical protein [Listeria ilorinensis]|uniref:hypothetical protein n=1 Tax=Listeria ilorinensis TaxID=2867439 RepID=UPI001EF53F67|nr:hypothetical protein [Listeria ilorinensis]
MRFQRLINTRDLEFYRVIQNGDFEDVFGYLLIFDKRKPAVLRDFTVFFKSHMKEEVFAKSVKENHVYAMFFHFTDLEEESEIPKFTKVVRFIEDLLEFKPRISYYIDNFLIDQKLEFEFPHEYQKIGQFAELLVEISGRDIPVPKTTKQKYLYLSQ